MAYQGSCTDDCVTNTDCPKGTVCRKPVGSCDPGATGKCGSMTDCYTPQVDPVCGCNGTTYSTACLAFQEGVSVEYLGECNTQAPDAIVFERDNRAADGALVRLTVSKNAPSF